MRITPLLGAGVSWRRVSPQARIRLLLPLLRVPLHSAAVRPAPKRNPPREEDDHHCHPEMFQGQVATARLAPLLMGSAVLMRMQQGAAPGGALEQAHTQVSGEGPALQRTHETLARA